MLGCFLGQGLPQYYPIDDRHPTHPRGAYAESKLEGENLCEQLTRTADVPTVCLRPPGVFDDSTYAFITDARASNPEFEWSPFWEYGAFIDVRDLADAVFCALTADLTGHHRLLVCAPDISSAHDDSITLARRLTPDVPVRNPQLYDHSALRCARGLHTSSAPVGLETEAPLASRTGHTMTPVPPAVLQGFGVSGVPRALPGGQGTSVFVAGTRSQTERGCGGDHVVG